MIHTLNSLKLTQKISDEINNQTFHHHYHILFDIANTFGDAEINYVEIGCYAGGSACLMLQRPKTNVISIDLGKPINPDIVNTNVKRLNTLKNNYTYILGNSHNGATFSTLFNTVKQIDILFIDGDHSYSGVIKDFNIYSKLIKPGGYIVFDDYNDYTYSPEVKLAVDDLVRNIENYEILGCLPNVYKARPEELTEGNCFIIKKL